jgi:hypothetical protein
VSRLDFELEELDSKQERLRKSIRRGGTASWCSWTVSRRVWTAWTDALHLHCALCVIIAGHCVNNSSRRGIVEDLIYLTVY